MHRTHSRFWKLVPALGLLILIATPPIGGRAAAQTGGDPSLVGQWGSVVSWPIVSIHANVLTNGKVLVWPRDGGAQARVWDPATGGFTQVAIPGRYNIFCTGHSHLADGRVFVTGGHVRDGMGEKGSWFFNSGTNSWTRGPDMNAARWYPTNTTLANGDVLVVSGSKDVRYTNNTLPQVYQAATNTFRNLSGAVMGLDLYPGMHVAPDGRVFMSFPSQATRFLNTSGTGTWSAPIYRNFGYRGYGSAVMYDDGKLLVMGGGDPPTAGAEVIDLNLATPSWRNVAPMAFARRQLNATLLPDGNVFVSGGTSAAGFNNGAGAVLASEAWNPSTETWSTMASAAVKRGYHHISLLLPDGRVLTGGSGGPPLDGETDQLNIQIYSPPYLFKGTRPTIGSAPASVGYGSTFTVQTAESAAITAVTWVRLGSVTHAIDMNQRINRLSFTAASGSLNVTAPSNPNLCPPGHYLLFILNGNGVPSVAKVVQIV